MLRKVPIFESSLLKNETDAYEQSSHSMSSSLKMKWISSSIVYLLVSSLHKIEIIFEQSSHSMSILLKNETDASEQSSHSMSSSLKNETDAFEQSSHSMSSSLKNEMDLLKHSLPFGFNLV